MVLVFRTQLTDRVESSTGVLINAKRTGYAISRSRWIALRRASWMVTHTHVGVVDFGGFAEDFFAIAQRFVLL